MTDANASTTPVFRSIVLDNGVTITLGEPLSAEAIAMVTQIGPQTFRLKPGTYKRAKEIDVKLGAGKAVHQMDFTYAAEARCHDMVTEFEGELGPPTSQHDENTQWRDSSTLFQLLCLPVNIRSFLRDLAPTAS